jgi:hypothetical protein
VEWIHLAQDSFVKTGIYSLVTQGVRMWSGLIWLRIALVKTVIHLLLQQVYNFLDG